MNQPYETPMKLYGSYTSPFVRHCRIALLQQGIEFEFIETDYTQSAQGSAAMRVPYLEHQGMKLHDSMSILRYIRQLNDHTFCRSLVEYDLILLVNTALDSTINLFLLQNSGVDIQHNDYTLRQQQRIDSCLNLLNQIAQDGLEWNDAGVRLACFIDWAQYRKRIDFSDYPALLGWLQSAQQSQEFQLTAPP